MDNELTFRQVLENSFIITIDDSYYGYFIKTYQNRIGLDMPLPKKFNGFTIPNGIYKKFGFIKTNNVINCTLAHVSIIKYCQMLNLPYAFVFEDDAFPRFDVNSKMDVFLKNTPDDSDMLIFGWTKIWNKIDIGNPFYDKADIWGSHAYVIFQKYYQKYLDNMKKMPVADCLVMNDKTANIYTSKDIVFIQRRSFGLSQDKTKQFTIQQNDEKYLKDNFGENIFI